MIFRRLTHKDINEVSKLLVKSYSYMKQADKSGASSILFDKFMNPDHMCLIAESDLTDEIVGFCDCHPNLGRLPYEVHMLCVHPEYRRVGLGTELVKRAISFAEKNKAKDLIALVDGANPDYDGVKKLYFKLDFRHTGSIPNSFGLNKDEYIMHRSLR